MTRYVRGFCKNNIFPFTVTLAGDVNKSVTPAPQFVYVDLFGNVLTTAPWCKAISRDYFDHLFFC